MNGCHYLSACQIAVQGHALTGSSIVADGTGYIIFNIANIAQYSEILHNGELLLVGHAPSFSGSESFNEEQGL